MSSCLDSLAAGYGLQDKTVQQQDKKQYVGDSYDKNGNVTNSPLLELANNLAGKAGTAQGRADMAFGGGGGIPTASTNYEGGPAVLWNKGFKTPAQTIDPQKSAPGPTNTSGVGTQQQSNSGTGTQQQSNGGTGTQQQSQSGAGTQNSSSYTPSNTGGVAQPSSLPPGGVLNPNGTITIPTTIPAGTPMPGTPGYAGPGM